MRFLCLLSLVGCVISGPTDQLLEYSLPSRDSQQIPNPIFTTTLRTTGAPVEVTTRPAVIDQNDAVPLSTETLVSPGDTYESYVTPVVTEPAVTVANSVLGFNVRADVVTETVTQLATALTDTVTQTSTFFPDASTLIITDFRTITAPATVLTQTVVQREPQSTVTVTNVREANPTPLVFTITQSSVSTQTVVERAPQSTVTVTNVREANPTPLVFTITQSSVLTQTVVERAQPSTFFPDASTLIITDFKTITAPATVLTQTVVQRAPQSTVTVTQLVQEANTTPLVFTITQSSFITVTQTSPFTVTQRLPLPTLPTNVPIQTLTHFNFIPNQGFSHPTFVPRNDVRQTVAFPTLPTNLPTQTLTNFNFIQSQGVSRPTFLSRNDVRNKYASVPKLPLFFGKSIDQTSIPSEEAEGEFLIIKPAGPIVPLTEAPSINAISNDDGVKTLDNDSDEELDEPIVSLDEVTPAIDIAEENFAKSLDSDDGVGKSLDIIVDEDHSDFIDSFDEVTPTIDVADENLAKSLDNSADNLVEITTNKPAVTTRKPTTIQPEETSTSTTTTATTTAPHNIPKALTFVESGNERVHENIPKSLTFVESGDQRVHDESLIRDALEIYRGNLVFATRN